MSPAPVLLLTLITTCTALSFPSVNHIHHRPDVPRTLRPHPLGRSQRQRALNQQNNPRRAPKSVSQSHSDIPAKSPYDDPDHDKATVEAKSDTITVYSSCNEINIDGLYYIKPMPSLPILPVICSNGYAMLDVSLDQQLRQYPSFLTSWDYGRIHTFNIMSS